MTPGWLSRLEGELLPDSWGQSEMPQASVLVLIDAMQSTPGVVLTRRARHLRLHAGEVAFPGGMCDSDDHDHWHTALREADEEIALPREHVRPLGTLPSRVSRTGIEVYPCVAELVRPTRYRANPEELDTVFEVPLAFLAEAGNLQYDRVRHRGGLKAVPRYDWQEHRIWGMTAGILVALVNRAFDAGLELEPDWRGMPGIGA